MALRGEGVREKLLVSILKKPGRCLPGSKRGIDPRLSPSGVGGENLEFLRDAEPDDARIEREDVGRQAGIVRVQEGIGDRRLVEDILHIGLERQIVGTTIGNASCKERACQYV